MEYKSRARLLGLPFVHMKTGRLVDGCYERGVAKGWIAVGDISFGVLFSVGGIAVGGVALGGVSLGGLAVAGLSIGVFSLGGVAFGVWAVGGLVAAIHAAFGGAAFAFEYAMGGLAVAEHANDAFAKNYFAHFPSSLAEKAAAYSRWLVLIPVTYGIWQIWKRIKERKKK